MTSLWKFYPDIENFDTISKDKQNEIITSLMSESIGHQYNYASVMSDVINKLTDKEVILKLFDCFIKNGSDYSLNNEASYMIIKGVYDKAEKKNKKYIKEQITNARSKKLHRSFLLLKGRTVKEEELGLRSLSGSKYAPSILYINRYKPNVEALRSLPPVTRLNVLEALVANQNISYNIFSNFKNEDEFRAMLFGAVLRHRDRVEVVCDKFDEMSNLGKKSKIIINCNCANCGDYEIVIKSTRVRTQTGYNTTSIGQWISGSRSCSLCGHWGDNKERITCEG